MTDCVVWWSEPITESDTTLALLSPTERERFAAYRRVEDQRRFLTGRVVAKSVAGRRLGLPAREVVFDATCPDCDRQHGPVRLPETRLRLSISHSGDRVGVAVTEDAEVGLDVESATRDVDDSLLTYALNESELATLPPGPPSARTDAFFMFWTRKEAIMKATGRGLRIPLRSLTLSGAGQPARLLGTGEDTGSLSPDTTRMADLAPGPGYHAAVALITGNEVDVTERWWTAEQLSGEGRQ